ncbi:MAG: stage IV sporulation protein A, partial [Clostridia bacterium]|nr:stage IV sporulation protein A [Clostridia bacterium]
AKIDEDEIGRILTRILEQFSVLSMSIHTPEWLSELVEDHWLLSGLMDSFIAEESEWLKVGEAPKIAQLLENNQYVETVTIKEIQHGKGNVVLQMSLKEGLFNQILAEQCGTEIKSDAHLLSLLCELVQAKKEYDRVAQALKSVRETGYGLVPPGIDEMTLQEPEIMRQGKHFGVRLRANAPSLHMIRVNIQTEVSPVVGTEEQSEEMVRYLMEEFEKDPQKIWQSNLFGKPLYDLVREGLSNKLMHMPADTQLKVQETLEKIINEGSGGMICILL